jgi:uncharacterized protein YndB with AHSA1/START domain
MSAGRSKPNEIAITRVYDAPVAVVWDAWTDPEKVAKWWGPRGFTLTTHGKELRPGGSWDYTMHGPDGTDYPNLARYLEVEPLRKLVYDHGGSADRPPLFRVTVLFSEREGRTTMEMTMTLPTAQAAEQTRQFIREAGGNATWDRLAEYLEKQASGKEQFVIHRSFAAPLATVFRMWTDPEHLRRWLPPPGFAMELLRADIRAGGSSFFVMSGADGATMHARFEYLEIQAPDRLVYRQQFCDENERVTRHPLSPTWPETMRVTVLLAAEAPDQTRVTVIVEPVEAFTSEELATFTAGRAGMTQGWGHSFDALEALLSGQAAAGALRPALAR